MLDAITTALTTVITWFGTVITSVTSTTGALAPLLPVFAIGIAVTIVFAVVGLIRRFTWGA